MIPLYATLVNVFKHLFLLYYITNKGITMNKSDFFYDLPEELIAQHPLEPRDSSRMMVLSKENDEILHKQVMVEGLLSIQAGENPRVIEEKLKAFLAPVVRKTFDDQNKEE